MTKYIIDNSLFEIDCISDTNPYKHIDLCALDLINLFFDHKTYKQDYFIEYLRSKDNGVPITDYHNFGENRNGNFEIEIYDINVPKNYNYNNSGFISNSDSGPVSYSYDKKLFMTFIYLYNLQNIQNKELNDQIEKYVNLYSFKKTDSSYAAYSNFYKKYKIMDEYLTIRKTNRGKYYISESTNQHLLILNKIPNIHSVIKLSWFLEDDGGIRQSTRLSDAYSADIHITNGENNDLSIVTRRQDESSKNITTATSAVSKALFTTSWYLLTNSYGENKEFNKIMDKYGELLPYEEVK